MIVTMGIGITLDGGDASIDFICIGNMFIYTIGREIMESCVIDSLGKILGGSQMTGVKSSNMTGAKRLLRAGESTHRIMALHSSFKNREEFSQQIKGTRKCGLW
jgi:hypothetical protein